MDPNKQDDVQHFETPAPQNTGVIFLRHPHTGHTVEVDNLSDALTPWMVKGYTQYHPPVDPAKE